MCCHPACVCLGGRQRLDTHPSIHMSHPLTDDETRVVLSLLQEEGHGDYINANFIRVRLVIREGVALGWVGTGFRILLMNGPFPGHRWKPGLHCNARTPASHSVGLLAPGLGVWGQGQLCRTERGSMVLSPCPSDISLLSGLPLPCRLSR